MALASPRFEVEVGPILLPLCGFWVISPLGAMAQEAACGRRFPSLASLFPILHLPLLPDAVPRDAQGPVSGIFSIFLENPDGAAQVSGTVPRVQRCLCASGQAACIGSRAGND